MEKVYVVRLSRRDKKSKNNRNNDSEDYIFNDKNLAVEFFKKYLDDANVDYSNEEHLDFKINEGFPFGIYEDENEAILIQLKEKEVLDKLPQIKYHI